MDDLIDVYTIATQMAMGRQQTVGEKNDYYITLEQLERIIKGIQDRQVN